jgi:TPR repeat protein
MLGKMYENGEGCVKDMETAVYWYKQFLTAPHHDPRDDEQPLDFWIDGGSGVDVEVHLGDIYYYGQGGIRQNYKTAFTHYNAAAKAYDISVYAKYMIATMYERGDGIKQNFEKALKFYKQVFRWSGKTGYRDAQEKVEELSEYLSQQ